MSGCKESYLGVRVSVIYVCMVWGRCRFRCQCALGVYGVVCAVCM